MTRIEKDKNFCENYCNHVHSLASFVIRVNATVFVNLNVVHPLEMGSTMANF